MDRAMKVLFILSLIVAAGQALAQGNAFAVKWQQAPSGNDPTRIGLGYPVPVPQDSLTPINGFRSYESLNLRHLDLAMRKDIIESYVVGTTHKGRDIWAYVISSDGDFTVTGSLKNAMQINGGIHAREWQSPEFTTGLMERFFREGEDQYLYQYLVENARLVIVPVNNVDGFIQTQSFYEDSYIGADPISSSSWPRDGRMRRKNMLDVDEDFSTVDDHLLGVDLNRNNNPFWGVNPLESPTQPAGVITSSANPIYLTHHGETANSEPETQARLAATELAPVAQLVFYVDAHSFGQFTPWYQSPQPRLRRNTYNLALQLSAHHFAYPPNNYYSVDAPFSLYYGAGGGSTDEQYAENFDVISWTLEIEPDTCGADYGGLCENGHDGFILPESQVRRMRANLSETYIFGLYNQAGPPSVRRISIIDSTTGAVVQSYEWQTTSPLTRELDSFVSQPLAPDRQYRAWIAFDKPMVWREDGEITVLPGTSQAGNINAMLLAENGDTIEAQPIDAGWLNTVGDPGDGFYSYQDDAAFVDFTIAADALPETGEFPTTLSVASSDMMDANLDANPATVAHWENGGWNGYENINGIDGGDAGGPDRSMSLLLTDEDLPPPFLVEPGTSSAWSDPTHNGEGFIIEILPDGGALVYWFTYDEQGNQRWFVGTGRIVANRMIVDQLVVTSGATFGADFDPADVNAQIAGHAEFLFDSCGTASVRYVVDGVIGRQRLQRFTQIEGLPCGEPLPTLSLAFTSGSYFDPTHDGEGFIVQLLPDGRALIYWFSYSPEGEQAWFFGSGTVDGNTITVDEVLITSGGRFGPDFDPDEVAVSPWGSMQFELSCGGGSMTYAASLAGYDSGGLDLSQLTELDGLNCN